MPILTKLTIVLFYVHAYLLSSQCNHCGWSVISFSLMLMKKKKIASPENLAIFLLLITRHLMCDTIWFSGKYVNGATIIVDGGLWLSRPRHIPKEEVKALSKVVEKKVRASGVGVPSSKLWWHLWLCSSSVCSVSYMSILLSVWLMPPVHAHGLLAGWAVSNLH